MAKISRVAQLWSATAAQAADDTNKSSKGKNYCDNKIWSISNDLFFALFFFSPDNNKNNTEKSSEGKHNVNPNTSTQQTLADAFWYVHIKQ